MKLKLKSRAKASQEEGTIEPITSTPKNKKILLSNRRIPRPAGITYLTKRYNEEINNIKLKNKIRYQIHLTLINHYLTNGFKIGTYNYNLLEYRTLWGIPDKDYHRITRELIQKQSGITDFSDVTQIQNSLREKLMGIFLEAYGDKHLINQQLHTLLASQGARYQPFISSEVNKILKTNLDATKNLADIARSMLPASGLTINNNLTQTNTENQLTITRAIEIMEDEPTLLELARNTENPTILLPSHIMDSLPDINAITQTSEMSAMVSLDKKAVKAKHTDRREALNDVQDVLTD